MNKRLRLSLCLLLSAACLAVHKLVLQSTCAVVFTDTKASSYPHYGKQNNHSHSIAVTAVLTATWVSEREENARRICKLAEDALGVQFHVVNATKLDMHGDALDEIRANGYFKHFQNYFKTKKNSEETHLAHIWRVLLHPRVAYAHAISDRRKNRLYQVDGKRVAHVKLGGIGNLGLFGILADFVS